VHRRQYDLWSLLSVGEIGYEPFFREKLLEVYVDKVRIQNQARTAFPPTRSRQSERLKKTRGGGQGIS